MTTEDTPIHHGKNIKRFREMLDLKQEALAAELGEDWTQRRVSLLEQRETVDHETLKLVAKALKVPVKAIENFSEKGAVNYFNTFEDAVTNNGGGAIGGSNTNNNCTFNPIDKLMEAVEEIKQLNSALIKEKDEKIALLEKMLNGKK
jgi:transcriptional regulator with XRE-family HTH domain